MVARDCLGQQQQQLCVLCQASAWSHSPPCLQPGERHQKVVQSTGIWSQAMCEPWAARLLWALCACHFIARLQVTPLILALRFEMAEPHRNAQAGGIPQGLRLRGEQLRASHAGRAAVARGGGCGWVHALGAVGLGLWVPAATGEGLQPFGSTSDGRASAPGTLQNAFGRSRSTAC